MKINYETSQKYGVPEQKKFPMPDVNHVRSAIKFFNYVEPRYEKELANAILKRMKEYGLTFDDFTVGKENRFSKYIPESTLAHHGIKGQKWGVRRFQNEDRTLTEAGKERYGKDGSTGSTSSKDNSGSLKTEKKGLTEGQKKALKTAAIIAGTAAVAGLAAYGAMKYSDSIKVANYDQIVKVGKEKTKRYVEENTSRYLDQMKDGSLKSFNLATSNEASRLAKEALEKADRMNKDGKNPLETFYESGRASDGGYYSVGKSYVNTIVDRTSIPTTKVKTTVVERTPVQRVNIDFDPYNKLNQQKLQKQMGYLMDQSINDLFR